MLRFLNLIILTCCFSLVLSNGGAKTWDNSRFRTESGLTRTDFCELPAPASLSIVETGTNYITISWATVQHAYAYEIRVKEWDPQAGQWILVRRDSVFSTQYTATNLKYATTYCFEVAAKCSPTDTSPRFSVIIGDTIIIDLVDMGLTQLPPPSMIRGNCPDNCLTMVYDENETEFHWFDVGKTVGNFIHYSRYQTWVEKEDLAPSGYKVVIQQMPLSANPSKSWESIPVNQDNAPPPCAAYEVYIRDGETKICKVTVSNEEPPFNVCFDILEEGYSVKCLVPGTIPPDDDIDVYERSAPPVVAGLISGISASNPFSDFLRIKSPHTQPDTPVSIQLFDANGRLVLDEKMPAVQEYNLPTSHFAPGFYVLKVSANQNTQTLKVVKVY